MKIAYLVFLFEQLYSMKKISCKL